MGTVPSNEAVLLLADGTLYKGKAAGKIGTTTGEICFNTGMTGYQEVFTDPSYYGQVLVTTNAHIGNYGTKEEDQQSIKNQIEGLVCKNFTNKYSRPLADHDIQEYCEKNNLVCIYNVDTRHIVRHIRDKGAMNCIISSENKNIEELQSILRKAPSMEGLELASFVTTKTAFYKGDKNSNIRIAVLDFGTKHNILDSFVERGAFLKVFPAKTTYEEMQEFKPNGYFLSNGPGDPSSMHYAIKTVKKIIQSNVPVFGICLGHQILCLGFGIPTYKMHNGHRGINHPVKNLLSGKCEITSQNHGFAVQPEVVYDKSDLVKVTHINLNDNTIEGIASLDGIASSVQYHPESCPGPHDSRYLFDKFINIIKVHNERNN